MNNSPSQSNMQNKYEVLCVVGEGAYGIVYKCRNKETKEIVAIKKFKETDDEIVKKTMRRELKMLKILKHDNVVYFQEAFKRKGNLFLVFEYVERNLLELLQESPDGLKPPLIRNLIYQLCKAIKYLHEQNIIHRDIKPENLLINDNMQLKLCDFGFARKISMTANENLTDYVATRWYRSPELLITNGYYGPEVDYWAIGCIMGELADGNPLFPGENETDQLHCIQKVLGNLPQEQIDIFYKNPLYDGKHLLDVEKPETLERRYMGKLSKTAISLMKGLLELDPTKRLNGKTVFEHPYFECFKKKEENKENTLRQRENHNNSTTNINNISNLSTSQQKENKSINEKSKNNSNVMKDGQYVFNHNNMGGSNNNNNNNTNDLTTNNMNSNSKDKATFNTTNINIFNYNTFTDNQNPPINATSNGTKPTKSLNQSNSSSNIHNNNNHNKHYQQINQPTLKNSHSQKEYSGYTSLSMPKMGMMTITNQFPSMNIKKIKNIQIKPKTQQQELSSSISSFNFNGNKFKNNISTKKSNGYKTFYSNNVSKGFHYNNSGSVGNIYNIQNSSRLQNSTVIEEEEGEYVSNVNMVYPKGQYISNNNYNVYKDDKKKKAKGNPLMKTNTTMHKLSMYYLGGNNSNSTNNNVNKGLKGFFKHNANISCYGGNFGKVNNNSNNNNNGGSSSHFQLPSLGKMYNPGYYANYKPKKYYY